MGSEQESLLQAIREFPDDDLPRLIYADYLDERGDPQGELIRVQCELACIEAENAIGSDVIAELKSREADLLNRFATRWTGITDPKESAVFRRGFVESLSLVVETSTFTTPQVVELPKQFALLETRSCLRSLTIRPRVRITDGIIRDNTWLVSLTQSPALISLNKLDLSTNQIGEAGVEIIVTTQYLNQLTDLRLTGWDITTRETDPDCHPAIASEGVLVLAHSAFSSHLAELDISLNEINHKAVQALADSPHLGNLRRLRIRPDGPWPTYQRESELLPADDRQLLRQRFHDVFDG